MPTSTAIKPVYALVGPDAFLQLQRLSEILNRIGDAQRVDIDGERAELADVLDELRSFAMFGGRKIVVVNEADALITRFRAQLEDYVAQPSDSGTLILRLSSLPASQRIAKAIAKTGTIENCDPPKDIPRWIIERGRSAHHVIVDLDAARMLADLIGDDLGRIDNELAKLSLSAKAGRIGPEQVGVSVAFQREQQMSEMVNAVAAGRPADALKKWRQMLQTDPSVEFRAVTWLTFWLTNVRKSLLMRRQGMQPLAITQALRIWPRELQQPFMQTVQSLGDSGAAKAIDLLAEIDRQSKSGVGQAAENVERFILSMTPART